MNFKITIWFKNGPAFVYEGEVDGVNSMPKFYRMLNDNNFIRIGDTYFNTSNIESFKVTKL